jgi:hypothetical protein
MFVVVDGLVTWLHVRSTLISLLYTIGGRVVHFKFGAENCFLLHLKWANKKRLGRKNEEEGGFQKKDVLRRLYRQLPVRLDQTKASTDLSSRARTDRQSNVQTRNLINYNFQL